MERIQHISFLDITGRLAGSVGLWTLEINNDCPLGPWNQGTFMLLIVLDWIPGCSGEDAQTHPALGVGSSHASVLRALPLLCISHSPSHTPRSNAHIMAIIGRGHGPVTSWSSRPGQNPLISGLSEGWKCPEAPPKSGTPCTAPRSWSLYVKWKKRQEDLDALIGNQGEAGGQ